MEDVTPSNAMTGAEVKQGENPEELKRKIAELEAQLNSMKQQATQQQEEEEGGKKNERTQGDVNVILSKPSTPSSLKHKRKLEGNHLPHSTKKIFASDTPSPKRPKLQPVPLNNVTKLDKHLKDKAAAAPADRDRLPALPELKPSNVLSHLSVIHANEREEEEKGSKLKRSNGFHEPASSKAYAKPLPVQSKSKKAASNYTSSTTTTTATAAAPTTITKTTTARRSIPTDTTTTSIPKRDPATLRLIEKLEPGPYEHQPPPNDPSFQFLEPHSGINLSSRKLAHTGLEEHMRGRYFISPSLLYSVVKLLPGSAGYEVPVEGDWITIGVIAKRNEIGWTAIGKEEETKSGGRPRKKYMSLKLVDFGTRSSEGMLHGKGTRRIRGDALLTMLLFEADEVREEEDGEGGKIRVYRGGSGGGFEACMKLHEGAVIAVLNPKIMKPYKRSGENPHPTENVLAITPTSAESIAIIGQAKDLGMCGAVRRDGKICGDWCDKRIGEVCEYHLERAVAGRRAGRAEFTAGTSGMSTSVKVKKNGSAQEKWGLLKEETGTTYVFSGQVVGSGPEYVGEKIGRGRAEREKKRREEEAREAMLSRMLGKKGVTRTKGYSAETVKRLGFDPAGKKRTADERTSAVVKSLQRQANSVKLTKKANVDKGGSGSSSELEIE